MSTCLDFECAAWPIQTYFIKNSIIPGIDTETEVQTKGGMVVLTVNATTINWMWNFNIVLEIKL